MSAVLEQSNAQLIKNLNGQVYTQPNLSPEMMASPMYQSAMAGQGPSDPFALERIAAQGQAARSYSDAMARQADSESMHAVIRSSLMAVPYVGLGLSFAYDPITKALGFREPEELYTQSEYVKANMASTLANSMIGQMGGAFAGGNMSISQANSMADNMYDRMRGQGFQGLELGRIMPMLGESGLMSTQGGFQNAEEALTQFEDRLGGFLDKIATTVKNTSADIESATVMAINESMLSGSRNAVAGNSYTGAADTLHGLTGMSVGDSEAAMRMSLGSWGNSLYDRSSMAESLAMNVGGAITASRNGGVFDAAWIGVDAGQVGMQMGAWGNQYWAGKGKDLGRMWSDGAMPGGEAWDSIVAGNGIPEGVGSYGDIGNLNSRLEAQYYGMQAAAENPAQMMVGAMGMTVHDMEEKGITTRPAQIMYLRQQGHTQQSAARFLSVYDQQSSQEGRLGSMFESYRVQEGTAQQLVQDDIAELTRLIPQISAEQAPQRASAVATSMFEAVMSLDTMAYLTAEVPDSNSMVHGADRGDYNMSAFNMGMTGILFNRGYTGEAGNGNLMWDSISESDNFGSHLRNLSVNRRGSDSSNLYSELADLVLSEGVEDLSVNSGYTVSEENIRNYIARHGGIGEVMIGNNSLLDLTRGMGGTLTANGWVGALGIIGEMTGNVTDMLASGYDNYYDAERVLTSRFSEGPQEAQLLTRMAETGMFEGVAGMSGLDSYRTAIGNFDASLYLGSVTEGTQNYRESGAYGAQYREFLDTLEGSGANFNTAVAGRQASSASDQMGARDSIAQGGFGKSYDQLTEMQRNFVEEIFHTNDNSGEWAGRHSELIESAQSTALGATAGVTFSGGREAQRIMAGVASRSGVATSEIEAYAAWSAAIESGADSDTVAFYRNKITDMDKATRAYQTVSNQLGPNAQGQIISAQAISAFAAGAGEDISEDDLNEVWAAFRDDGKFSAGEIGSSTMDDLAGTDLGKLVSGDITVEDFFKTQGDNVPTWAQQYGLGGPRSHTNIPEFQGAMHAIVTAAGGVMPVVFASEGLVAQMQEYMNNSEVVAGDGDQGGGGK